MSKEPLDFFYSKDGLASQESFLGETMNLLFPASRRERIAAFGRTLLASAGAYILSVLCLIALVFAFILLISWVIDPLGLGASLTDALRSESAWAILKDKKPY